MCFIFSSKWPQVSNYASYATILCSPKIQEMKLMAPRIHQKKLTHTPKNVVYYKYPITLSKRGKFTRTLILWFNLNSPPMDLSIGVRWSEIPFPRSISPLFVCYNMCRLEKNQASTVGVGTRAFLPTQSLITMIQDKSHRCQVRHSNSLLTWTCLLRHKLS